MASENRIRPWEKNPAYWQYKGEPVLLLGGTVTWNLFQIPDLKSHLDLLRESGGNYVRNGMSAHRREDVWQFAQGPDGRYDLEQPNPEYWQRFDNLLDLTYERDIIVQIELWDRFDYARYPWLVNPFNPKNNVNYSGAESGLAENYPLHPGKNQNRFFFTVPDADDNQVVLPHQQRVVDWLLTASLRYDNVLYCMDNETNGVPQWGAYWAQYIKDRARRAGVEAQTTEMWNAWTLTDPEHLHTIDHPELYTFVDVSQNNQKRGQTHYDNLIKTRHRIHSAGPVRPMNNVKIYGADTYIRFGSTREGIERFWRNIFAGCAAVRFHRPPSGLGLGPIAQKHLRSAHMFADTVPVWEAEPRHDLLVDPVTHIQQAKADGLHSADNIAYCLAQPEAFYAVFFPSAGKAICQVSQPDRSIMTLAWLNLDTAHWHESSSETVSNHHIELVTPDQGRWIALLRPNS